MKYGLIFSTFLGLIASASFGKDNGQTKKIYFDSDHSSYYRLFLEGEIYRDCCYECPYADDKRVGDITLGDFWGAKEEAPELFGEDKCDAGPLAEKNKL